MADWIALGAVGLNLIVLIVGITWKAGRQEIFWQRALNKLQTTLTDKLDSQAKAQKLEFDRFSDDIRKEFGEGLTALRTKIHEVELFVRDTYVRRDSFALVISKMEDMLKLAMEKLEVRLDKIERMTTEASHREDNPRLRT